MHWRDIKKSVIFPWIVCFILINLLVTQDGEKNPMSRFATMRAMSEQQTFQIDDYKHWTMDWAQTPDGHYYSNKAPGPMLIGLPVFWGMDQLTKLNGKRNVDKQGRLQAPGWLHKTAVCFFLQILPFALLLFFVTEYLFRQDRGESAVHFVAIAILFGNTAALFMNNWFGHGITALFLLAAVLAMKRRKFLIMGLTYGLALLSDYGAATMFLPLLLAVALQEKRELLWIKWGLIGAILPGGLWIWYHQMAFGGIFTIASKFQNPDMLDLANVAGSMYGVISLTPDWGVVGKLLFGFERGILFTQPWVLIGLAIACWKLAQGRFAEHFGLSVFVVLGFLSILWMNAGFGQWHGGYSAGPRYMSMIFPIVALMIGIQYPTLPSWVRRVLWGSLGVSVLFRAMVYGTTILIPDVAMWPWIVEKYWNASSGTPYLRFSVFVVFFAVAAMLISLREKRVGE